MKNEKYLFIDDKRLPSDAYLDGKNSIYLDFEWEIVENYNQFVEWITKNGLPKVISFDHDLAPSHYTPYIYWNDYVASKKWQESQFHTEPTGVGCALWLVKYCVDNKLEIPFWLVHSLNPVGSDKIKETLNMKI